MFTALALGSNIGNRLENIQKACEMLLSELGQVSFMYAPIYRSAPVACPEGSPDFFNTVVTFDYEGTAQNLHSITQKVENALGREKNTVRNAPRIIDIDILLLGDQIIQENTLIIPHPRMHLRKFVLQPLADIAPNILIPSTHKSVHEHLMLLAAE